MSTKRSLLLPGIKPYAHQKITLRKLRRKKYPRLYDISDAGTGKTLPHSIAWAERRQNGGGALLVLCPKTAMESVWKDQMIQYFGQRFWIRIAAAHNRVAAFVPGADVYITNLDAVKYLASKSESWFKTRGIDTFIIDESEAYKHQSSARSKAARKVCWLSNFKYGTLLTGTPWATSVTEMWHQMMLIDNGKRIGNNFYALREVVQIAHQTGPKPEHRKWEDKEGAQEAIVGNIADVCVRHDFDECTDIPKQAVHKLFFTLGKKHRDAYEKLRESSILTLESGTVTAVHAAALRTKLLQVTSGSVYTQLGTSVVDPARYELIVDLIKQRPWSCIVFYIWRHQRNMLCKLATKEGVSHEYIDGSVADKIRTQIVREFQAGNFKALFLQEETATRALTLTKARTGIWAGPPNLPTTYKQGNRRIRRIGQKEKTEILLIIARHTLEERVYDIFQERKGRLENMLEMLTT